MKKSMLTKLMIALMLVFSMIQSEFVFAGKEPGNGNVTERVMLPGDPNLDPNWDWTQNIDYMLYWGVGHTSGYPKSLPYYDDGSPTYGAFFNFGNIDFRKEDGWVLFARDFGTPTAAPDCFPYFILYNKFYGRLRLFVYTYTNVPYKYVFGTLSFIQPELTATGMFTYSTDDGCTLNDFDKNYKQIFMLAGT